MNPIPNALGPILNFLDHLKGSEIINDSSIEKVQEIVQKSLVKKTSSSVQAENIQKDQKIAELEKELGNLYKECEGKNSRSDQLRSQLAQVQKVEIEKDQMIASLNADLAKVKTESSNRAREIVKLQNLNEKLEKDFIALQKNFNNTTAQLDMRDKELAQLKNQLTSSNADLAKTQTESAQKKQQSDQVSVDRLIDDLLTAVTQNDSKTVKVILDSPLAKNIPGTGEKSLGKALYIASQNGYVEIVTLFLASPLAIKIKLPRHH